MRDRSPSGLAAWSLPSRRAELDGKPGGESDPLGAMVLLDEPAFPSCLISVRSMGVFWMSDEHSPVAKTFTIPAAAIGLSTKPL